ncbi:MAG: type IX secretion system sortase PorU [Flavobacteriales bacterium]|nr:type IX secretion system sortase PorU [Flavobacteriales bacterium]
MHRRRIILTVMIFCLFGHQSIGQSFSQNITVLWGSSEKQTEFPIKDRQVERVGDELVPFLFYQFPVHSKNMRAVVADLRYDTYNGSNAAPIRAIEQFEQTIVEQYVHSSNGKYFLNLKLFPFRNDAGKVEKLTGFRINFYGERENAGLSERKGNTLNKMDFAGQSVLSSGEWYKMAIPLTGVYKLDAEFLSELGLDLNGLDPNAIRVYGHSGGLLPEPMDQPASDDLIELPLKIFDENSNNRFDPEDAILLYAETADVWRFDPNTGDFRRQYHYAEKQNYLFLTIAPGGKRIISRIAGLGNTSDTTFRQGEHLTVHNNDEFNFLQSGRDWWGNSFKNNTQQTFSFDIADAAIGQKARIRHRFTARSTLASNYSVSVNGTNVFSRSIGSVPGDYQSSYHASPITETADFTLNSGRIDVSYRYTKTTAEGDAWIDFIELQVPRELKYRNQTTSIFLPKAASRDRVRLEFENGDFTSWDISDPLNPVEQILEPSSGRLSCVIRNGFTAPAFVLFKEADAARPEPIGKINNQNLHGAQPVDYLIVVHPDLLKAANRLADFHTKYYGHSTLVASTDQIYNEFSSGKEDPTAIRNFAKMLFDRGKLSQTPLRYILLFGDGSYDYKDYTRNNSDLVPTFQSRNSHVPVSTYSSDDYYAILEDGEGYFDVNGAKEGLDIAVGRIPAANLSEAELFVDKIIEYHDPETYGDWRNRLTFLGDDEDANAHFWDTEVVTAFILDQKKEYNVNKIYLDAFEQISFGSGQKYPEVNIAINKAFEKGHLIFNYLGHGGGSGMAHERVITRDQILAWENMRALPLVITATCELSRFDDPAEKSPGELMLFSKNGGAIGLITTTRLVIIGNNSDLNEQIFDHNIFELHDGEKPTLGQVYSRCKNNSAKNINQRNFILLGDPAMKVAYPEYKIVTTTFNDSVVGQQPLDTMKAFERVRIQGAITNNGEIVRDFNGFVYPTIFDKFANYRTLANDPGSYATVYRMQNSVLYRGKVSVINGEFSFQFVVPKDIAYEYGRGKISYYAENGSTDGHGFQDNFYIGGTGQKITDDSKGPDIKLYLDHSSFNFGGTTGTQPLLLADLFDENGINTVGNGIGRDLLAILDEGTREEKILILNDFYISKLDSYQEGRIEYKMEPLPEGRHTLKLKVWDVYNNSSEAYTEFVVAPDAELQLNHILNYPNPFTTHTTFHFDHNKVGHFIDVSIQIFSVAGNLVNTLRYNGFAESGHFQQIEWDGKDEFGDALARGVYLYKVHMKSDDDTDAKAFQKLMLLR